MKGFPKTDLIQLSEEEMQRLYFDGRPIRHYCLQCRGPKLMLPVKPAPFQGGLAEMKLPEKLWISCRTCHVKYVARLAPASKPASTITEERKTELELLS